MAVSYSPLPERVIEAHVRTSENYKWLQKHWEDISKKHSNQFIAVADREVVYSTSVHMELLNYLFEHRDRSDIIGVRVHPHDNVLLL